MEKRLNLIIRLILIIFLVGVIGNYVITEGVFNPRLEQREEDKDLEIFKKVVALIDSRINDKDCTIDEIYGIGYGRKDENDGGMTKENFERLKKTKVKLVDANVENASRNYSMRDADIWLRYEDEANKNFYVYVKYSEDAMTKRVMDDKEDSIWNAIDGGVVIYSDYLEIPEDGECESLDWGFPRTIDYVTSSDSDTKYIELDEIEKIKSDDDYLNFAETRTGEIRDYLKSATNKTTKNEKRISLRIKRAVLSAINNKSYGDYASNEGVFEGSGQDYHVDIDKIKIIKFEDQIVKRKNYVYPVDAKTQENVRIVLIVQLVIFGLFWGLCTKFIPKLCGNEYSTFFKGALYGALPFLVAVFMMGEIHAWLAWGFWLGFLPVIEGVIIGIQNKKNA